MLRADGGRWGGWCHGGIVGGVASLLLLLNVGALRAQEAAAVSQAERARDLALKQLQKLIRREQAIDKVMETLHGLDQGAAAVPLLLEGLRSSSRGYYIQLDAQLGNIEPATEETIQVLLDRGDTSAISALAEFGPAVFPFLQQELASQDARRRYRAFTLLSKMASNPFPHLDYEEFVPVAIAEFADPKSVLRDSASLALRRFGPAAKSAVPKLIEILNDPDEQVVNAAVSVLGAIGRDAESAIPALAGLPRQDENLCSDLAQALEQIGPAAVPTLIELLSHSSEKVRTAAAVGLGHIGPPAREARIALQRLLTDPDWVVRVEAAVAIWATTGDAEPVGPALRQALEHSVDDVGATVMHLGPAAQDVAAELVNQTVLLEDRNARVRPLDAIRALGPTAAPGVPALMRLLATDPTDKLVLTLAAIGPAARPAVVAALKSEDEGVRAAAVATLGQMRQAAWPALPDLARIIEQDSGRPRDEAHAAVGLILSSRLPVNSLPATIELVERDENVRSLVQVRLKAQGADLSQWTRSAMIGAMKPSLPVLMKGLTDSSAQVRKASAAGMIMYRQFARPAVPQLQAALDDIDLHVRLCAAAALWASGDPDERPRTILIEGLNHPRWQIRQTTAAILGELGPVAAPAIESLLKLLNEPRVEVRLKAADAIRRTDPDHPAPLAVLMNLLEDERIDLELRAEVAKTLGEIGPPARPMLPRLRRVQFLAQHHGIHNALIDAQWRIEAEE